MIDAFRSHLPDWKLFESSERRAVRGGVWQDNTGLVIRGGLDGYHELSFAGSASFLVSVPDKTVQISAIAPGKALEVEHLLLDQIVPRLLAHTGQLTIHGAGILVDDRLIVLLGKSGRGKSTIAAWFVSKGYAIVGDDAVVTSAAKHIIGMGLGPKLRLGQESARYFAPRISVTSSQAGYAGKTKFDLPLVDRLGAPIAAFFKLNEPEDVIRLSRVSASRACMAMVEESFALNPMDVDQAGSRLRAAAFAAERVPFYELAYPRRYELLDDVGEMMVGAI